MFGQCGAMQLSGANLLIAAQQIARGVQQAPREVQTHFETTLAKGSSASGGASFEPLDFKKTEPERPQPAAATTFVQTFRQPGSLGANVDIRV